MVGPTQLRFLGETRDLQEHGWDDPRLPKLWRYNLHYFEDLTAREAEARAAWHVALLERWVREVQPGRGTGWEPYPTSQRIVSWVKWALGGSTLPRTCVDSLATQCRWLTRQLEFHLLGNHLFANAKALVFGGLFFQGEEADRWLALGARILERELPEQILDDGGQFERSTMYHALAVEDVLDLCNVIAAYGAAAPAALAGVTGALRARVRPMIAWLAALSHPDGEIAFFNDAAFGIAPSLSELRGYARALALDAPEGAPDGLTHLAASGYVRLARGAAAAVLDVAPVGPDYLPGHAHADTLSFELSLAGERVVVNSGTSCYGDGAERLRQRGTGAHSTLQVDGADSSEVWSAFRVARRARPFGLATAATPEALTVTCSHDGYRRLPSAPVHTRTWLLEGGRLRVRDVVTGAPREAVARFFFHPGVEAHPAAQGLCLRLPSGFELELSWSGGRGELGPATWHPRFGVSVESSCLEIHLAGQQLETVFRWGATPSRADRADSA